MHRVDSNVFKTGEIIPTKQRLPSRIRRRNFRDTPSTFSVKGVFTRCRYVFRYSFNYTWSSSFTRVGVFQWFFPTGVLLSEKVITVTQNGRGYLTFLIQCCYMLVVMCHPDMGYLLADKAGKWKAANTYSKTSSTNTGRGWVRNHSARWPMTRLIFFVRILMVDVQTAE